MKLTNKSGEEICSPSDWLSKASPKAKIHKKVGRSAISFADLWFSENKVIVPGGILSLLKAISPDAKPTEGIAEKVTGLDSYAGGRNHDLLLLCDANPLPIVVGIEAKVDETYGGTVAKEIEYARKRPRTNKPERSELLAAALFGRNLDNEVLSLRDQLLTGVAGTLREACHDGKRTIAFFMVLEIITHLWNAAKAKENQRDFEKFLGVLKIPVHTITESSALFGPTHVPGNKYISSQTDLYIGKVTVKHVT